MGTYTADLPSGASSLDLGKLGVAFDGAAEATCNFLGQSTAPGPVVVEFGAAVCAGVNLALAVYAGGTTIPAATAIEAGCTAILVSGAKALENSCTARDAVQTTSSFIDFLNKYSLSFDIQAQAVLNGQTLISSLLERDQSCRNRKPFDEFVMMLDLLDSRTASPATLLLQRGPLVC
jgi:hypothetical protein